MPKLLFSLSLFKGYCAPLLFAMGGISATLIPGCQSANTPKNYDDGSELYAQAKQFDAFVWDELTQRERISYHRQCAKRPRGNPFCFGVNRAKYLLRYKKKEKKRWIGPITKKPVQPARFRFSKNGALLDLWTLRRAQIPALLKTLETLPREKVERIANQVSTIRKCPHKLAPATAATLEDYLPDESLHSIIAKLYVRGAYCSKKGSADREQYFSRAGIFFLRANQPKQALRYLKQSPSGDAFTGRSLYWLQKAYLRLGDRKAADRIKQRLFTRHAFSFHATALAMEEKYDLGIETLTKQIEIPKRSRRSPSANSILEQAEISKRYGFDRTANLLAKWLLGSYRKTSQGIRLYALALSDAYTQVSSLPLFLLRNRKALSRPTLELSYPRPYLSTFRGERNGLDVHLLYAIAHKESKLDPNAISPANAQGLMQVTEPTARTVGVTENLLDIETNVAAGAKIFRSLKRKYDFLPAAIAAYNAGEDQADSWIRRYPKDDPVLFVDLLSYRETRNYVGLVLRNYYWYRRLYAGDSHSSISKRILRN